MNTASFIAERFAEITTIVLHIYFLYRTLDAKIELKKQILISAIFALIRMAYFILAFKYQLYFAVIAGIVYASFVFTGSFMMFTTWTIILVVLDGIVDASIISLILLFNNTAIEQIDKPGFIRIAIIIIAKVMLLTIYYFTTRKVDKSHPIERKDVVSLLMISVGGWILLEVIFKFMDIISDKSSQSLSAAGSIVLLLIMTNVISLYNRITLNSKELAQSKLQILTTEMTTEHIRQIDDLYAKLSSIRHDLHNHFSAISGYLNAKHYSALEHYLEDLTGLGIGLPEIVKHPVLNAIIGSRKKLALDSNINFSTNIILPEKSPLTDVDLCILISNILDNAFEANRKTNKPRFIDLCTRIVNSYWVVACHNATDKQEHFRATGYLKTTKNGGFHGIGTKQIHTIAEKSGGFVTYHQENYVFTILAMIKLPM